jgi:opacity protein-like surface antigen
MKNVFARRITVLSILMVFLTVPASTSFGQDFTTSVGQGAKAMLFSFDGLATLNATEFDGGFGAKYYLMDQLALRIALPFAFANQSVPLATGQTGTDGSMSGVRWGLSAAAEYHLLKTRVSPYVGGGLGFANASNKIKSTIVSPSTLQTTTDNRAVPLVVGNNTFVAGTSFNVGGIAGVELFIIKEVSLSAEYQLGYTMIALADQKITVADATTTTTTTTKEGTLSQIGISTAGFLTLSVYF